MARTLSTAFKDELTAKQLMPLLLVKFEFDSGDLNLWNGIGALQWSGDTYTGTGSLGSISGILESGLLKAANVTFQLSGVDDELVSIALQEDYPGRIVRLWFAVLNSSFALVADPYLLFRGTMDVMQIDEDPSGTKITLTCENELLRLRRVTERRYTHEDQQLEAPGDTFFNQVAALQDADIVFGGGT